MIINLLTYGYPLSKAVNIRCKKLIDVVIIINAYANLK